MVHWVLVSEVESADWVSCPWVNDEFVKSAVCGHVERIESERFQSSDVERSFEDPVVVIVPVIRIEDPVVVVIEWVGAVASIKPFKQVIDSIVVVVEVGQIIDSIVVVVVCVRFFEVKRVGRCEGFNSAQIGDDSRHYARVRPHQISDGGVIGVVPRILVPIPVALAPLSGGLGDALPNTLAFLEAGDFDHIVRTEVLNNSEKGAGEHQEHNCQ